MLGFGASRGPLLNQTIGGKGVSEFPPEPKDAERGRTSLGLAPTDFGMAAGKRGAFSVGLGADSSADAFVSENLRQRSSRVLPNAFSRNAI